MLFVFVVTFIVFPGVAFNPNAELSFLSKLPNSYGWFIVFMNTTFSIFDTVGRKAATLHLLSDGKIKVLTASRVIFIGTFYCIAFGVRGFQSDWLTVLNITLCAFTNGYFSTLCAIKAPMAVEAEHKGQVGGFTGITIVTGIIIGSSIALAMTPVLDKA